MMQKHRPTLKAEHIRRYLLGLDYQLETMVLGSAQRLITTDQSLYEAFASIEDKSKIDLSKLTKLLEVTDIVSFTNTTGKQRPVLTPERAEEIRQDTGGK